MRDGVVREGSMKGGVLSRFSKLEEVLDKGGSSRLAEQLESGKKVESQRPVRDRECTSAAGTGMCRGVLGFFRCRLDLGWLRESIFGL